MDAKSIAICPRWNDFHVLNRGVGRRNLFDQAEGFAAFERVLAAFMQQLTNTHLKRWKEHRHETGYGPLYQGRYKSFPVETNSEILAAWPLPRPIHWIDIVNEPQTEAEREALRHCVQRGTPFGNENWGATTASRHGLEASLRPRGRPKKATDDQQSTQASLVSPNLVPVTFSLRKVERRLAPGSHLCAETGHSAAGRL